jgi:hypothetical protein
MRTIGIDPDLHTTAYAVVEDGEVVYAGVVSGDRSLKGKDAAAFMARYLVVQDGLWAWAKGDGQVAVEVPRIYPGAPSRPSDLMHLSLVAGAAIAASRAYYTPYPQAWKGSVPKEIHQARICKKLGWDYVARKDYVVPKGQEYLGVLPAQWKHGLALWAAEQEGK